jgi:hypothetical protein
VEAVARAHRAPGQGLRIQSLDARDGGGASGDELGNTAENFLSALGLTRESVLPNDR